MNNIPIEINDKSIVKSRRKVRFRTLIPLYLLLLPTVVSLFIFNYIPMYGIIISFQDYSVYKGIMGSDWVGLKHFSYFLHDDKFWSVMRNTLLFNVYDIVFGFTSPIIFALLANEIFIASHKRIMQTISYLPHFLSWVVVAGMFYQFLSPMDGLLNGMLTKLFGIEPLHFMTQKHMWIPVTVFADIWKSVGWSAILYFAVITGIDKSLYEAATVDGAGRFKQAIHITLPSMVPMIVLLFLLKLSQMFVIDFQRFYLFQNPLVYDVSEVISTYMYRIGLEEAQYSLTTAIGLAQSVLAFTLLVCSNRISKKVVGLGLY